MRPWYARTRPPCSTKISQKEHSLFAFTRTFFAVYAERNCGKKMYLAVYGAAHMKNKRKISVAHADFAELEVVVPR